MNVKLILKFVAIALGLIAILVAGVLGWVSIATGSELSAAVLPLLNP